MISKRLKIGNESEEAGFRKPPATCHDNWAWRGRLRKTLHRIERWEAEAFAENDFWFFNKFFELVKISGSLKFWLLNILKRKLHNFKKKQIKIFSSNENHITLDIIIINIYIKWNEYFRNFCEEFNRVFYIYRIKIELKWLKWYFSIIFLSFSLSHIDQHNQKFAEKLNIDGFTFQKLF